MATEYQAKGEGDRKKLEKMMLYAQSAFCRWKLLLEYFSEEVDWEHCGNCDNCLQPVEERLGITVESKEVPREETPPHPAESDVQEGDIVTIPKYGTGEVESVEGDKVTVVLPTGEAKKFKKDFIVEEADAE
jgi:ATP-dependent DNA helicase RecQ